MFRCTYARLPWVSLALVTACNGRVVVSPNSVSCDVAHPDGTCPVHQVCALGKCIDDRVGVCGPGYPFGECEGDQACVNEGCHPITQPCSAAVPAGECPGGQICVSGTCQSVANLLCGPDNPEGYCASGPCPQIERCDAGVCVLVSCQCSPTNPLGECDDLNFTCVDGVCQSIEVACSAAHPEGRCATDYVCLSGACVPLDPASNTCSLTRPTGLCPDSFWCNAGTCVAVTPSNACSTQNPNGACDGGATCVEGVCTTPACDAAHIFGTCSAGLMCDAGVCIAIPCGPLYPSGACPGTQVCSGGTCGCDQTCQGGCSGAGFHCDTNASSATCGQCLCDTSCAGACHPPATSCNTDPASATCGQCICDTTCASACNPPATNCNSNPASATCGECICDTACGGVNCAASGKKCDSSQASATCGQCVCDTSCGGANCAINGKSCNTDTASATCGQCICTSGEWCSVTNKCCASGNVCVYDRYCRPPCAGDKYCGAAGQLCCGAGQICGPDLTCIADCAVGHDVCGVAQDTCCDTTEACVYDACLPLGATCTSFLDCGYNEYCEPTLGKCLPTDIGGGETCKFPPPPGIFDPAIEWRWAGVYLGCAAQGSFDCADGLCAISCGTTADCGPNGATCINHRCSCTGTPQCDTAQTCGATRKVCAKNGTACGNLYENVNSSPTIADINHDGFPEVVFRAYTGSTLNQSILVILDGRDGGNGTGPGSRPTMIYAQSLNSPVVSPWTYSGVPWLYGSSHQAIINLDSDPELEVIAVATTGVVAFNDRADALDTADGDGAVLWTQSAHPLDGTLDGAAPAFTDFNADGRTELVIGTAVLDGPTGTMLAPPAGATYADDGGGSRFGGGWIAVVADVDLDGLPEQVTGNRAFNVWRDSLAGCSPGNVADPTCWHQSILWEKPADNDGFSAVANVFNNPMDATCAASLGGNDYPEVINVVVNPADATLGRLFVYSGCNGATLMGPIPVPKDPLDTGNNHGGPPTVADFDGDGKAEIAAAGNGCYAVYDPDCNTATAPERAAMPAGCNAPATDHCGTYASMIGILWDYKAQDFSSAETGSSVFDFQGDGISEVLYNDECFFRVLEGPTGAVVMERANSSRTASEYPLIVDVDGDHSSEIVLVANHDQAQVRDCCVNNDACAAKYQAHKDYLGNNGPNLKGAGEFCNLTDHPENTSICQNGASGITVYGDTSGKWVRTRPIWPQHSYHVTDVNLDPVTNIASVPAVETNNWLVYNNYRQNVQGYVPLNAPNLQVATLTPALRSCPPIVTLHARIANNGSRGFDPATDGNLPVSFYVMPADEAVWTLAATLWVTEPLGPGRGVTISLDVDIDGLTEPFDFRAVANDDGLGSVPVAECVPGDNTALALDIVCIPS